jgi:hypothetical protein
MLFVTFHGGKPTKDIPCPVNNVYAYDETVSQGPPPYLNVLCVPANVDISELRDLCFANGFLYVANGAKTTSNVLCFAKAPTSALLNENWFYVGAFASGGGSDGNVLAIDHPFAVELTADGRSCFVSSQDTNVVTLLNVSTDGKTGSVQQGAAASCFWTIFRTSPSSWCTVRTPDAARVPSVHLTVSCRQAVKLGSHA